MLLYQKLNRWGYLRDSINMVMNDFFLNVGNYLFYSYYLCTFVLSGDFWVSSHIEKLDWLKVSFNLVEDIVCK